LGRVLWNNARMEDNRIVIPRGLRNLGIFVGLLMVAVGLIIGWRRSGMSAQLPPTGWRR
jgi:hypothetical protein